jgi:hypothetical protein
VTRIAAYSPDLIDRSKIASAFPDCRFVASPHALVGLAGIDAVVVDLAKKGVLDALAGIVASGVPVIAYGSHVDRATLAAATAAGCAAVVPRSSFFGGLPDLPPLR